MTRSDETNDLSQSTSQIHDLSNLATHVVDAADARFDRSHMITILAFLNREIDQSAVILRDLARRLSDNFCAISEANDHDTIRQQMLASTIALQNEDRVQQRLRDLRTAISLLENALHHDDPAIGADLDRTIMDQFDMEEMRFAFAHSIGIAIEIPAPPDCTKPPSLGDVDLF